MSEKTILVWFRNDLRMHDNEILLEACRKADKVLPVYCFDPYYFTKNASGNQKTGAFRARFLLESVADLRASLQEFGGELIIRLGDPAAIIPQLAEEFNVSEVYHHREVAHEETEMSEKVETALWKIKLNLKHFIGHTLYHKEDLPFPIKDIPDSFATFKKKVERDSIVRPCIGTPDTIKVPYIPDAGELPSLQQLGLETPVDDPREHNHFIGGETTGLKRLQQYFLNDANVYQSKGIKSPPASVNFSSLSPWIALGCVSLRQVYWEAITHQQPNSQHAGLLLHLLWRDYFRFMFKKHGQKFIVAKTNNSDRTEFSENQEELFENWKNGHTGVPLVDAIMHELNATGYINNYSRQIVAGYLVRDIKVDWTKGAAYFEEKLIDYSPASNWGNWAFIAGVNDAGASRYTISAKETTELATKDDFIDIWLPELRDDSEFAIAATA